MSVIPFGFRPEAIKELNQTVQRPYVQVDLKISTGDWITFSALVDSGADYVLLPRSATEHQRIVSTSLVETKLVSLVCLDPNSSL